MTLILAGGMGDMQNISQNWGQKKPAIPRKAKQQQQLPPRSIACADGNHSSN